MKKMFFMAVITAAILFSCATLTAAKDYENLTYTIYDGEVTITNCHQGATVVEIPSKIEDMWVTRIDYEAFRGCTALTSVTIPDSVTYIDSYAFYNCSSLKNIRISENVTSIFNDTFANCVSLESIVLPDRVESVGMRAFSECTNLKSVTLGRGIKNIGDLAFNGCTNIESVYISDLTAYLNCEYRDFGSNPMYFAKKLYVGGVEAKNLVLSDEVKQIPLYAFYGCDTLTSVSVSKSVTDIDISAFSECDNFLTIDVDEQNNNFASIEGVLFDKEKKTILMYPKGRKERTYKIPDGVTAIGKSAFAYAPNLERVIIPDSVTDMRTFAFFYCPKLSSLIIGDGLNLVEINSTTLCNALRNVYYKGTMEDWRKITFKTDINGEPLVFATKTYSYASEIITELSEDGKTLTVHPFNLDTGMAVILALYNDHAIINCPIIRNRGTSIVLPIDQEITDAKVMVWEGIANMKPICTPEVIK